MTPAIPRSPVERDCLIDASNSAGPDRFACSSRRAPGRCGRPAGGRVVGRPAVGLLRWGRGSAPKAIRHRKRRRSAC